VNNIAVGKGASATGDFGSAYGSGAVASRVGTSAFGLDSAATNENASAFGRGSTASSLQSSAFGAGATAVGDRSAAAGNMSHAIGVNAVAIARPIGLRSVRRQHHRLDQLRRAWGFRSGGATQDRPAPTAARAARVAVKPRASGAAIRGRAQACPNDAARRTRAIELILLLQMDANPRRRGGSPAHDE
jgi:hypothetical protein